MSEQAELILLGNTVMLGVRLQIVDDMLRIIQNVIHKRAGWFVAEDLLYWVYVTYRMYSFLLENNSGEVRVYLLIGLFGGMVLWEIGFGHMFVQTASKWLTKLLEVLKTGVVKVMKFIKKILKILLKPFKISYIFSCKKLSKGGQRWKNIFKKRGMKNERSQSSKQEIKK